MLHRSVLLADIGGPLSVEDTIIDIRRIGLVPDVKYRCDNILYNVLYRTQAGLHITLKNDTAMFRTTVSHYMAIAEAMERGCEFLSVFECGIRFLRSTALVRSYMDSVPKYADLVLYEYSLLSDDSPSRVSGLWHTPEWYSGYSGYFLSRRGMVGLCNAMRKSITDGCLLPIDHYFRRDRIGTDICILAPRIPLCIVPHTPNTNVGFARSLSRLGVSVDMYTM